MNKFSRIIIDGLLLVLFFGLLALPVSSIWLASYKGMSADILGARSKVLEEEEKPTVNTEDDEASSVVKNYRIRVTPSTDQTTQSTEEGK